MDVDGRLIRLVFAVVIPCGKRAFDCKGAAVDINYFSAILSELHAALRDERGAGADFHFGNAVIHAIVHPLGAHRN